MLLVNRSSVIVLSGLGLHWKTLRVFGIHWEVIFKTSYQSQPFLPQIKEKFCIENNSDFYSSQTYKT